MPVYLVEPFDNLSNWTGGSLVTGRVGTGIRVTSSNVARYFPQGFYQLEGIDLSIWWQQTITDATNRTILQLRTYLPSPTSAFTLTQTNGVLQARNQGTTGTIIGSTAAGSIVINTWNLVRVRIAMSDTVGTIEAWHNGVQFANGTGLDTLPPPASSTGKFIDIALSGPGASPPGNTSTFDDLTLATFPDPPGPARLTQTNARLIIPPDAPSTAQLTRASARVLTTIVTEAQLTQTVLRILTDPAPPITPGAWSVENSSWGGPWSG